MRSIAVAMTWEHCKKNAWLMLVATLGPWAFLALPLGGLLFNPVVAGNKGFALVLFIFALVGFVPVALRPYNSRKDRLGFPLDLYTRPISTVYMVALRMILDVATPIGIYLGLALLVWATSGVSLPLAIPILFLVVIAAWMEAIFWSLGGSPLLLTMIGIGIEYILFLWLYIHPLVTDPNAPLNMTWRILSTIPLTALAYAVAVIGVRFDRRGERINLARLVEWIGDRIYAIWRKDRVFWSARSAQFWIEWHRKGYMLPALNLLALAVYAGVALLSKQVNLVDGLTFLWTLGFVNLIFYPFLVAILVNLKERGLSQDLFWATRPLGDNVLLLVRLRVAIASLLASWGVWLAGAITITGLLWAMDKPEGLINDVRVFMGGPEYLRYQDHQYTFLARMAGLVILNLWTIISLVGSLHMTGRKAVAALWMVPLWIYPLWRMFIRQDLINTPLVTQVEAVIPWAIGIGCLAGTSLAYWAALRKGRITHWLSFAAFVVYLVLCQLMYPWPDKWSDAFATDNPGAIVFMLGLATLPLLPLALGPLAISWNRHR